MGMEQLPLRLERIIPDSNFEKFRNVEAEREISNSYRKIAIINSK